MKTAGGYLRFFDSFKDSYAIDKILLRIKDIL